MKHEYTDPQLQAAIDGAFPKGRTEDIRLLTLSPASLYWKEEAPNRLNLIKAALASLPEPMDEESMLLNLLAVIHRDGGHYQAKHGTRKAVEDACKEWQRLILIAEKTGLTEPKQSLSQLRPIAEAGEVPEGCVRHYTYKQDGEWTTATKHRAMQDTHYIDTRLPESAENATPETFEAHGKTWTKHKPGDAMPCDGSSAVMALLGDGTFCTQQAEDWNWNNRDSTFDIVGWRYADKPTPEPLVTKPISLPLAEDMSLRDWFAGQALAGIVQAVVTASLHNSAQTPDDEVTARWALKIADAMLAAREVKP